MNKQSQLYCSLRQDWELLKVLLSVNLILLKLLFLVVQVYSVQ
jgi:hypothetical protein